MPMPQKDFYLTPVIEFVDKVPKEIIEKVQPSAKEDVEGSRRRIPQLKDVKKYRRIFITIISPF